MANGDFVIHNKAKHELGSGNIDFANDTFRMMLVAGLTRNVDTQEYWSDVSANEIALSGYTAGGETLASLAFTRDDTNDRSEWDFADVTWTNLASGSVSHAVVVRWTGTASTSVIIGTIELVTQPNGGNYTVAPGANGAAHVI